MKKRILVIGDSCNDVFTYGRCERLCPDAPVPILIPTRTVTNGGMAKNVYENIKSIYSDVDILTNKNTITKTRYVHEKTNQMFIRIDEGEQYLEHVDVKQINLDAYEIIVLSDYCKGFLQEADMKYICENHPTVLVDTKKLLGSFLEKAKFIKINEIEYNNSINAKVNVDSFAHNLIVTLGDKGCRYKDKIYPVKKVEIKDMTGAGDTFMACLAVKYLQTSDINEAIEFANQCASIIVQHKGVNRIADFL